MSSKTEAWGKTLAKPKEHKTPKMAVFATGVQGDRAALGTTSNQSTSSTTSNQSTLSMLSNFSRRPRFKGSHCSMVLKK